MSPSYCASPCAISSVDLSFSGPNDIGKSLSSVMDVDLPSLSYIRMGILSCKWSGLLWSYLKVETVDLAEFSDKLSAHPTRARGWTDVCGNRNCADIAFLCSLACCQLGG